MKNFLFNLLLISTISAFSFAQVGIGTDFPDSSSALEVYSTNKGVTLPEVALTATTIAAPVSNPTNGLIIFNTTDNPDADLYKGLYYWNADNNRWETTILKDDFMSFLDKLGIERVFVIANENTTQNFASGASTPLTFSPEAITKNKDNSFTTGTDSYFTAPRTARYLIKCGTDILSGSSGANVRWDEISLSLQFYPDNISPEDTNKKVTTIIQKGISMLTTTPLTPVATYTGMLDQGNVVRCSGTAYAWGSPPPNIYSTKKFFYITQF
jgi:hypothetical protein